MISYGDISSSSLFGRFFTLSSSISLGDFFSMEKLTGGTFYPTNISGEWLGIISVEFLPIVLIPA